MEADPGDSGSTGGGLKDAREDVRRVESTARLRREERIVVSRPGLFSPVPERAGEPPPPPPPPGPPPVTHCIDGLDNDGDGQVDYPGDPGCVSATDTSEKSTLYRCDDAADNDGDGRIDYPADPGCSGPADQSEFTESPACHPSYPDVCIAPSPPDLDCDQDGFVESDEVPYYDFAVRHDVVDPDPHGFDGNKDGVGCETP